MSDIDQAFKEFLSKHNLDNTPGRRSAFEVIYPVYKKASVIESELAKQKLINQKLRSAIRQSLATPMIGKIAESVLTAILKEVDAIDGGVCE